MNSTAAQIDQATDILRATNDLLEARAKHRDAQAHGNVYKVIDAYVKVVEAERYLAQMYPPADADDYVAADMTVEPLPDCGETFNEPRKSYAMHADDPRKGQAAEINRANRGNV